MKRIPTGIIKLLLHGPIFLTIIFTLVSKNIEAQCVVAGSNMAICQGGTTLPLGGTFFGDASGPNWSDGGIGGTFSNPNILNPTWTPPALYSGVATLTLTATAGTCTPLSNTMQVTVNPSVPVSVTIAADVNPSCAGNLVTFTATPVNGGSTPSYQWNVNGSNAGSNSPTFSYTPANTDAVTCLLTSDATCATGSPALSNTVTMTVIATVPVSVTISPSANNVCAGTTVTFTATPVNGGASPSYQWKVNGINNGTNSPTFSYTPANTDAVTCVLTSNATCPTGNPATSNTVIMTVNPLLPVSVSISPSANPVCAGTSVTFTAVPTNGGTTPAYQWKVNGSNAGTNSTTYTYTPLNSDAVSCVLTSDATCPSGNPATSNTITMTVNPLLPVSVSISPSANPVCAGSSVTFTATPINGGTTPVYQWKVNGSNNGTNSPTFSYAPANNDAVTCVLTSNATCPTGNPATSNTVIMTVNPLLPVSVSISPSANPVCAGTSVTFTAVPTNGGTTPAYQWKVNGSNAGTNSPTYTYTPLNGDAVTCILTSNAICPSGNPATSNAITMTVNALLPVSVSISASSNPVCAGSSVTFTATPTNGGPTPSFQWKVNGGNAGSNSVTFNYIPSNNDAVTCILTSNAPCVSGNPATSNSVTMTVTPTVGIPSVPSPSGTVLCQGSGNTSYTTSASNATSYNWSVTGSGNSISGSGTTGTVTWSPSFTGIATVSVTANGCNGPSSPASTTVTINATPATPVVTVVDNCNGTSTLSTTATGSLLWSTGETTSSIIVTVAKAYTVTTTVNGCISLPGSGTAAPNATPPPPSVGTITPPTCTLSTGSVILSGLPATGTWTLTRYPGTITSTGSGTSTTVSGLISGTYNFTVSSQAGCTSGLSANVIIPSQPVTPTPPSVGTITQPTCSVATGSVILNGLPAGNWTINPGSHTGNTASTTIPGLAAGSYTFTVTNSVGCTSGASADVVINAQPATPTPPVVGAITQPTCSLATGSVVLHGLPSSGQWNLTGMPGNIGVSGNGTSTTVNGLVANTYTFTVTSSDGCTSSPSGNVVINAQPPSPSVPTQTVDCSLGFDHAVVTVTSPLGSGLMYNIDGGAYTSATSFTSILNGSHTITVMNSAGCITTGTVFPVSCGCVNGPSVTLSSISGSTCVTAPVTVSGNTFGGSATNVAITENGGGTVSPSSSNTSPFTFTYTPDATDAGNIVIITVTTNNPLGAPCASAVATYSLTVNAIPAPPTISTITQPTCALATGSVILNGLPSSGLWTITRTPGGVTTTGNGVSTVISGLDPGTYSFTVTSDAGCMSASSGNVIIVSQPGTLSAPVVGAIIQPTCLVSTGSVTLSGLPATGTWTLTRSPGAIVTTGTGVTKTISGLGSGVYTYTVSNLTGCASVPSSNVVINAQPSTPTPPTIGVITQPTCTLSTGSVALDGLPATGTWTLTRYPGTVNTTGAGLTTTISGLLPGVYNFTVANALGCTSLASGNVLITTQPVTPSAPVIGAITQPTCNIPTGSVILSGLPSSSWVLTLSPGGTTLSGTGIASAFSGLTSGTHTFTVTNSVGCISLASGPVSIVANASAPTLIITNPSPACFPGTADLTAAYITSGSTPGLTFTYWMNASGSIAFATPTAATEGTYYIKATNPLTGCSDVKSVTVTVRQQPVANAGPDQVLEYLFSTKLDALEPGVNETGTWSVLAGTGAFVNTGDAGTTVSNLSVGKNILLWTITNGACPPSKDSVTITVHDLIIPTLITPNHDGKNDYFVIKAKEALGRIELTVFDRTGARVYRNADYNNDWDGVDDRGNALPDDTYFFILKTQSGKTISKYIVIRR